MLEVSGLSVDYILDRGNVRAVDDVSFTVSRGEFLGIVGESGCRFRPRCPYAIDKCAEVAPDLYPLDGALVRCLRREDGSLAS
jgi:ABC-type dipeptide/oligopeptide/nickel transport system ATPase component